MTDQSPNIPQLYFVTRNKQAVAEVNNIGEINYRIKWRLISSN